MAVTASLCDLKNFIYIALVGTSNGVFTTLTLAWPPDFPGTL